MPKIVQPPKAYIENFDQTIESLSELILNHKKFAEQHPEKAYYTCEESPFSFELQIVGTTHHSFLGDFIFGDYRISVADSLPIQVLYQLYNEWLTKFFYSVRLPPCDLVCNPPKTLEQHLINARLHLDPRIPINDKTALHYEALIYFCDFCEKTGPLYYFKFNNIDYKQPVLYSLYQELAIEVDFSNIQPFKSAKTIEIESTILRKVSPWCINFDRQYVIRSPTPSIVAPRLYNYAWRFLDVEFLIDTFYHKFLLDRVYTSEFHKFINDTERAKPLSPEFYKFINKIARK
jgi:hypothetical protein